MNSFSFDKTQFETLEGKKVICTTFGFSYNKLHNPVKISSFSFDKTQFETLEGMLILVVKFQARVHKIIKILGYKGIGRN